MKLKASTVEDLYNKYWYAYATLGLMTGLYSGTLFSSIMMYWSCDADVFHG